MLCPPNFDPKLDSHTQNPDGWFAINCKVILQIYLKSHKTLKLLSSTWLSNCLISPADGAVRPHTQGWNGQECAAGAAHSEAWLRVQEPEADGGGGRAAAAAGPQPRRLWAEPGSGAESTGPQSHDRSGGGGHWRHRRVQQRRELQHNAQVAGGAAEAPRLHPTPQRVRRGGMGERAARVHGVIWLWTIS